METVPSELIELKAQVRAINAAMTSRCACYYCADIATCEDHVIPHSLLHRKGMRRQGWEIDTLPSCRECNQVLASRVTDTLAERKAHLAREIRKRYAGHLGGTPWTPEELATVSVNLLGHALEFNRVRELVRQRLAHLLEVVSIPEAPAPIAPRKANPFAGYVAKVSKHRPVLAESVPYRSVNSRANRV